MCMSMAYCLAKGAGGRRVSHQFVQQCLHLWESLMPAAVHCSFLQQLPLPGIACCMGLGLACSSLSAQSFLRLSVTRALRRSVCVCVPR